MEGNLTASMLIADGFVEHEVNIEYCFEPVNISFKQNMFRIHVYLNVLDNVDFLYYNFYRFTTTKKTEFFNLAL